MRRSGDLAGQDVGVERDRRLLAAHVDGDAEAFAELVRRHQDRLWAVALRTMGEREEAADALQDALVKAFRAAGSYRGDAAVTTWLHRIVVNACLDRLRRRAARPTASLADVEVPDPRDHHAGTDIRLDVTAALACLPAGQRAALVLVDMQGLSVTEAAAVLGIAPGTVKSRCSRGRAALVPLLAPAPPSGNPDAGAGVEARGTDRPAPAGGPATAAGRRTRGEAR